MVPRNRKRANRNLPDNLHTFVSNNTTYYRYWHPIEKKYFPMGTDRAKASAAARQLNAILAEQSKDKTLVAKVLGSHTLADLIKRYKEEQLPLKKLKASTQDLYEYRLNRFKKDLGKELVEDFTTKTIADYLDKHFSGDAYVKHRGTLIDLFRFAITKGWVDNNPAEVTYAKADNTKKRQRMTLEQFKALHEIAPDWLKIAMELAMLTLQGRNEIINMRFDDFQDDEQYLFVTRLKTDKHEWSNIRIKTTKELRSILKRARRSGIASPYVVHYDPVRRKKSDKREHWTQFTPNDFTKRFRELRDTLEIFTRLPNAERPTFHEIRSLGSWLYEKAGNKTEDVQKLMAHADKETTEYYQSGHEKKWLDAEVNLSLKDIFK